MLVLLMSSRMSLSVRWPLNCCGGRGGGGCRQGGSALEAGQVGQSRSAIGFPGGFTARRAPGAARQPVLGVRLVLTLCPGIVREWEGASLPGLHSLKGRDTRLWKILRKSSSAPPSMRNSSCPQRWSEQAAPRCRASHGLSLASLTEHGKL